MEEISQELALRMAGALRERVRAYGDWDIDVPNYVTEMRAIVALLPEPDLIEARALCADDTADGKLRARYMAGELDRTPLVTMALAGIRRGRELAKARAGEGSGE